MIILKSELNPADGLRKTVSQTGEEDHVNNPEHAYDNAGPVYETQGDAFVAGQDRSKFKDPKTVFNN